MFKKASFVAMLLAIVISLSMTHSKSRLQNLDDRIVAIVNQVEKFFATTQPQKVYLHLNKQDYVAGESVWFKLYLSEARSHHSDTVSQNLYVEISNSRAVLVAQQILRSSNGVASGDILLPDTLDEGVYQIKAFSSVMRNHDKDFIYSKYFQVVNAVPGNFSKSDFLAYKQYRKHVIKDKQDIDFQFLPEGGTYIAGIENRVAFKITNALGESVQAEGVVFDDKGVEVTRFKTLHNGTGVFTITPINKKQYKAKIELRDERTFTEKLPIPSDKGVVLQVDNLQTDNIKITVRTNISEFNDMILIGHVRGIFNLQQIIQASQFTKKDGFREYIGDFPRNIFPTGIVHFTLFDQQSNPLCERLCFVNHHDNLTVEYKTDKPIYSQHERVILDITVKDKNNNPAITNLSLAVNANADAAKPVSENIQTYYLLTSDLTGRIENPAFYFKDDNPETRQALDCVMLTHGWRRFVWSEILKDRFPEFKHKIETTMSLTGSVSKDPSNASSGVSNVKLTILDDNREQYSTTSKPDGTFLFTGLEFYDTTNVKIEAVDNANKPRSYIDLDDEQMPDLPFLAENIINPQLFATRGIDVGMSNSSRVTNEADNENYTIYGTPDASIDLSKGDFDSYTNLLDVISGRVAGVSVQGGSVIIRGVNSINAGTEPLWLVDGITVDVSTVKSMHPLDVDRIDFLKGSSTAIYGARGANGVIAIYTRRGSFNRRTPGEFKLLGYHKVRQFYAPKYEDKLLQASFTKAIYWNPVITTDANGKARVSFNNTDNQQPLQFTIEGISTDGKLLFTQ